MVLNRGANVEMLQLALKRAGYYSGNIDGIHGPQTQAAVENFQKNNGITPGAAGDFETTEALKPYLKGYIIHTIKAGDTFYKLSSQYNTNLRSIITANPNINPNDLTIGSKVIVPLAFPVVPTNVRYTSTLNAYVCEGLVMRYPFIYNGNIGKSVMGKSIPYLRIGKGNTQVFYNATHHANEWINTPVLLKFLEEYAWQYSIDGKIFNTAAKDLFNKATLSIVSMVNPDGVDLVNGVITEQKYYDNAVAISKKYPQVTFPSGWKANINGVDLNLQYPANWEKAKEVKYSQGFTSPAPRDFVGYSSLSEPESKAVYEFTRNNNFALTLSYHSQGEIIYWKYLDFEPKESRRIANYFGEVSGYLVEETPYASGFAGYKDWFIQDYDRPGYTIEVGKGVSPLPLSQFDKIYSDNLGILVGGITQI